VSRNGDSTAANERGHADVPRGKSKAEIGRAIGKDKKQVGKLIAAAIKHKEDNSHGND
jgi:hypothetical protein